MITLCYILVYPGNVSESCSVMYRHTPYQSGAVDHPGKESGAPLPWDIEVPLPKLFKKSTHKYQVPKTSTIQVDRDFHLSKLKQL